MIPVYTVWFWKKRFSVFSIPENNFLSGTRLIKINLFFLCIPKGMPAGQTI